jgi:Tfp pilus assembly protein PilV
MPSKKHSDLGIYSQNCQGFMLLEVLVAMSLILGVWITSVGAYQRLALILGQQDSKRYQIRKELDAFEIQERVRANLNLSGKSLIHESARVSGWNRSVRTSTQPSIKNKH